MTAATSQITYCPHPMLAAAGRRIISVEHRHGECLEEYFNRAGVPISGPLIAWVNGRPVRRDEWTLVAPLAGDVVVVRAIVEDGGDGGSDPVRTVLSIALLVAAPQIGGFLAGAGGLGLTGAAASITGGIIGSVVSVAGTLTISALVPPTQQSPHHQTSQREIR